MTKKSIVLSDMQNTNKKAVLTLEESGGYVGGSVRLYNFSNDIAGILSLGIYVDNKVYKAGLSKKSPMFYEFFVELNAIPNKFSCAVINFQNAEMKPILYGTSDGNDENIYGEIISEISGQSTYQKTSDLLDRYDVDFDHAEKVEIEKEIDTNLCEEKNCENCIYKKYFYENQKNEKNTQNLNMASNFEVEKEEKILFFDKLKPQIDKLFEKNPMENNLQKIIPDSKWVKIEYEDDGDFYVFGLLYDKNSNVKYVCYGVPAVYEEEPPKELSGFPIWTPLDKENQRGFGYWLTYQDAETGEPVKVVME